MSCPWYSKLFICTIHRIKKGLSRKYFYYINVFLTTNKYLFAGKPSNGASVKVEPNFGHFSRSRCNPYDILCSHDPLRFLAKHKIELCYFPLLSSHAVIRTIMPSTYV